MRRLLTFLAVLLISAPAYAEPIPQAELDAIYHQCIAAGPVTSERVAYCNCFTDQIAKNFSYQALATLMGDYHASVRQAKDPAAAVLKDPRIKAAVQDCRARVGLPPLAE